jgi:hypothetical protein
VKVSVGQRGLCDVGTQFINVIQIIFSLQSFKYTTQLDKLQHECTKMTHRYTFKNTIQKSELKLFQHVQQTNDDTLPPAMQ